MLLPSLSRSVMRRSGPHPWLQRFPRSEEWFPLHHGRLKQLQVGAKCLLIRYHECGFVSLYVPVSLVETLMECCEYSASYEVSA